MDYFPLKALAHGGKTFQASRYFTVILIENIQTSSIPYLFSLEPLRSV